MNHCNTLAIYILFPNVARFLKNSFIIENWKPFNTIIEGRGFQGGWPFSPPEREDQFAFFLIIAIFIRLYIL